MTHLQVPRWRRLPERRRTPNQVTMNKTTSQHSCEAVTRIECAEPPHSPTRTKDRVRWCVFLTGAHILLVTTIMDTNLHGRKALSQVCKISRSWPSIAKSRNAYLTTQIRNLRFRVRDGAFEVRGYEFRGVFEDARLMPWSYQIF